MKDFLPRLMATLTRHPRQRVVLGVDFEWNPQSWTHNAFRLYEVVFGRRYGKNGVGDTIRRPDIVTYAWRNDTGEHVFHAAQSLEGALALGEQYLRQSLAAWKRLPARIYIPIVQTPQGIPLFVSPFLFAIAVDNTGEGKQNGGNQLTITSYVATGSNGAMVIGFFSATADQASTCTFNSVGVTQRTKVAQGGSGRWCYTYSSTITAATANIVINGNTSSDVIVAVIATYTGVTSVAAGTAKQTGSATSYAISDTTTNDNSWQVMFCRGGPTISAGSGTTLRHLSGTDADTALLDTNAAIHPAGSNTVNANGGSATWGGGTVILSPVVVTPNGSFLAFM